MDRSASQPQPENVPSIGVRSSSGAADCQAAGQPAAHPADLCPKPRFWPSLFCPLLISPPASRLPFSIHPSTSNRHHNQLQLGRSGPKSGDHGLALRPLRLVACYAMVGVRVSSAAATEERLTAGSFRPVGKPSGTARRGGEPTPLTKITKRAFNRACKRANQALDGGTWYRGRWHNRQALASLRYPNPAPILRTTTAARPRRQRARPEPNLSLFVWNTGGLSSGMLLAWCDTQSSHDAIILIETHWRATPDYISGKWHCIHTSGYSDSEQPDRYPGILCMLSSKTFATPSVREIVPGRLLQVQAPHLQSQRAVALLGVYLHVQRTHLGAQKNKQVGGHIWHQLQQQLTATPARHVLLAAGDFNSTLHHEHPHVGPATPSRESHSSFDPSFQALLRDNRLTAANTWHARPSHTFEAPGVRSQIDYILVRLQDANSGARQASPLPGFPVGAHRCTNHLPLQSRMHLLPFAFLQNRSTARKQACDLTALQSAVLQNTAQAQALAASVESRLLQQPPGSDLCSEHSAVNLILLEETCKYFPPAGKPDCRVSARSAFRASAKTTRALHSCFKRPGLLLMRNIFDRLRYYAAFLRASKALRQQSLTLKRQFLQGQLDQAENAAKQGDQRALFLVARRLAPRSHRGTIRLQDASGRARSASAAMKAIVAYSNSTVAASPETLPQLPMQGTLVLGDHTFSEALSRLNVRKAVPATAHRQPPGGYAPPASATG